MAGRPHRLCKAASNLFTVGGIQCRTSGCILSNAPADVPHGVCLQIHFEDFRMFSESFGMQLDDDSLLALYHVHDPEGR